MSWWEQFKKGFISDLKDIAKGWWRIALIFLILCIILGSCFVKHDYDKGMECYKQEKYTEAVEFFFKGANGQTGYLSCFDLRSDDKGLRSSYMLGRCYFDGQGVKKDYTKAREYFEKVTKVQIEGYRREKGISCFIIGWMWMSGKGGKGVEKNYIEAFKWFEKARDYGCNKALALLGICYYDGKGVKQDYSEAFKLFEKARDHGCNEAFALLGDCYYNGKGISRDYGKAFEMFRKAAESNCLFSSKAYWFLGECYKNGHGTSKNREKERECKKKAAEGNCPDGQYWLGMEFRRGINEEQSDSNAVAWFKKAAEQGHAKAMEKLAWHYRYGRGVEEDPEKAEELEEKAKKLLAEKGEGQ